MSAERRKVELLGQLDCVINARGYEVKVGSECDRRISTEKPTFVYELGANVRISLAE